MADRPRKLIIHAGMHKTGSTAIQHWLHNSRLPEAHYFKWRNANHSDLFVLLFEEDPQDYFALSQSGYTKERALRERQTETDRIRKQIEGAKKDVFIFSAERISTAPKGAVRAMHDLFAEHFADIQVYVYVRKPAGFMTSMFQQHLKTGRIKFSFGQLWPAYRRRLVRLMKIFGEDNVHLRAYDPLVERRTEIVGDFAAWVGLETVPPGDIVRNRSMSAAGMALLYFYRKVVEPGVAVGSRLAMDRHILDAAQKVPGGKFHVDLECSDAQRQRVVRDLAWISDRMGMDFDDFAAPRPGALVFRTEDEILGHAIAQSHQLLPGRSLEVLDPEAPGALDETRARFRAYMSQSSRLRAGLRRRLSWGGRS